MTDEQREPEHVGSTKQDMDAGGNGDWLRSSRPCPECDGFDHHVIGCSGGTKPPTFPTFREGRSPQ